MWDFKALDQPWSTRGSGTTCGALIRFMRHLCLCQTLCFFLMFVTLMRIGTDTNNFEGTTIGLRRPTKFALKTF